MRFVEGGSESVSCLGRCAELSGRAEFILKCDDVEALVAIPAHRLLSCSLSLFTHFHAMGLPYLWLGECSSLQTALRGKGEVVL